MTWRQQYVVINGELQWLEGVECADVELLELVKADPWLWQQVHDAMVRGIVVGAA